MHPRKKITFLDLVIPFVWIYLAFLCFWSYFINGNPKHNWVDVVIIATVAFCFVYGVMSLLRDVKGIGVLWFFTFWRDIFKK